MTLASPLPVSSALLSGHQVFITRGVAARKKCPFHGDQNQDGLTFLNPGVVTKLSCF